jgi:hypothetical protein
MALSVSQLRAAVATQVLTVSGFSQSHIPPDYFGRNENSVAHKRFAVQMSAGQVRLPFTTQGRLPNRL